MPYTPSQRRYPSVVKREVCGWMAIDQRGDSPSEPEIDELELEGPPKRKATTPIDSERLSKQPRISLSEDSTRHFDGPTHPRHSGGSISTSSSSGTRDVGSKPKTATTRVTSSRTSAPSTTQPLASSSRSSINYGTSSASLAQSSRPVPTGRSGIPSASQPVQRNFPPVKPTTLKQTTLKSLGRPLSGVPIPSYKGKEKSKDIGKDRHEATDDSSDTLPEDLGDIMVKAGLSPRSTEKAKSANKSEKGPPERKNNKSRDNTSSNKSQTGSRIEAPEVVILESNSEAEKEKEFTRQFKFTESGAIDLTLDDEPMVPQTSKGQSVVEKGRKSKSVASTSTAATSKGKHKSNVRTIRKSLPRYRSSSADSGVVVLGSSSPAGVKSGSISKVKMPSRRQLNSDDKEVPIPPDDSEDAPSTKRKGVNPSRMKPPNSQRPRANRNSGPPPPGTQVYNLLSDSEENMDMGEVRPPSPPSDSSGPRDRSSTPSSMARDENRDNGQGDDTAPRRLDPPVSIADEPVLLPSPIPSVSSKNPESIRSPVSKSISKIFEEHGIFLGKPTPLPEKPLPSIPQSSLSAPVSSTLSVIETVESSILSPSPLNIPDAPTFEPGDIHLDSPPAINSSVDANSPTSPDALKLISETNNISMEVTEQQSNRGSSSSASETSNIEQKDVRFATPSEPRDASMKSMSDREMSPLDYIELPAAILAKHGLTGDDVPQEEASTSRSGSSITSLSQNSIHGRISPSESSAGTRSVRSSFSSSFIPRARKSTGRGPLVVSSEGESDNEKVEKDKTTSRSGTPEPPVQPLATPSTPAGRRIAAVKEPDYAKLRADVSDAVLTDDRELSAAIKWPAEKIPTDLLDMINRLPENHLFNHTMKHVFESMIEVNTAHDEPKAPPIRVIGKKNGPITPPWEFYYSNKIFRGAGVPKSDKSKLKGCDCIGPCDPKSKTCACVKRQMFWAGNDKAVKGFLYNKKQKLLSHEYPIFECNDACQCSDECMNRVIDHGRQHSISIVLTSDGKGWGVFADEKITRGTYLGLYAGEMILESEADERGRLYDKYGRTYLFDLDFYFLKRLTDDEGKLTSSPAKDPEKTSSIYTVDAFHVGNFTRFLNHSCDPNCRIVASFVNEPDLRKPTLTIFTTKDVRQGEELTFAYSGDADDEAEQEEIDEFGQTKVKVAGGGSTHPNEKAVHRPCLCGAANCRGIMF